MKRNFIKFNTIAIFILVALNPLHCQDKIIEPKEMSIENWETGDFSQFNWQFLGNADWSISDQDPYEGVFCAQSGNISDGQITFLTINYESYADDTLSFWLKVSCEYFWDFLGFYIDGNEMDKWYGEIPWQQASYMVSAGTHSFTWLYKKNLTIAFGSDACWIDYISFPQQEIEAFFTADTTVVCEDEIIYFFDQSGGPITEWNWTFEGGIPSSSTEQNPIITYPNEGEWDVFLEVSDGVDIAQANIDDFITVVNVPTPAPTPSGLSYVCASWGNTAYTTTGLSGISEYNWIIDPPEAGTFSGAGTNVTVLWEEGFLGEAELMVAGINNCGIGDYSEPLVITRYLPDVSVILPAYVALSTPPFELTGGLPIGGEYAGPGVTNGVFDPAIAGLGMHTITYTYTDVNFCSNFAIDSIGVTEYTEISHHEDQSTINIYPNPTFGSFKIVFNSGDTDVVMLKLYNSVNEIVWEMKNLPVYNKFTQLIQMENHEAGIYLMHITGKKVHSFHKIVLMK